MLNLRMRRWVPLLGALALLTACAGNADETKSSDDGKSPVFIGTSMPLSGQLNLDVIIKGYQLAIDEVNEAGGIELGGAKRELKLKTLDNRSDTTTMGQQVRSLALEDGVTALLGSCCQQNIDMQAQADALKTPLVEVALPVELLSPKPGYTWGSWYSLVDNAVGFYKVADGTRTNKRVMFVTNNDAQGVSTAKLWTKMGEKAGFTAAATKAVPVGTTDFSNVIEAGRSARAEVLVAAMTPPDCFAMWKQMKALDYTPEIAIGLQCAASGGWDSLGELGNGTLIVTNWTRTAGLPETQKMIDGFAGEYPNDNDLGGVAAGYHAASILIAAIQAAGTTDKDAINDALAETDLSSALGPVSFKGANTSITPTFIAQWENGDIHQVWPAKGAEPLKPLSGIR